MSFLDHCFCDGVGHLRGFSGSDLPIVCEPSDNREGSEKINEIQLVSRWIFS
jgi:hypothetical protein